MEISVHSDHVVYSSQVSELIPLISTIRLIQVELTKNTTKQQQAMEAMQVAYSNQSHNMVDIQEEEQSNLQLSFLEDLSVLNLSDAREDYAMNWKLDQLSTLGDSLLKQRDRPVLVCAQITDQQANSQESKSEQFLRLIRNLSKDGLKILLEPNAGGNSIFSEVLSFEMMNRFFGAKLEKTEMEIEYNCESSIVDYSVKINNEKIGVSVTRAFHYIDDSLFDDKCARALLLKKLKNLNIATTNVSQKDKWTKQLLHIWVRSVDIARKLNEEYQKLSEDVKSNTIVLVTVAPQYECVFNEKSGDVAQVFRLLGFENRTPSVALQNVPSDSEQEEDMMDNSEVDLDDLMQNNFDCDTADTMDDSEDLCELFC
jgi:hypothetical protein